MTRGLKENLLNELVGISLTSVMAERLMLSNGQIGPELIAFRFLLGDGDRCVRISGDSSGQFLSLERGKFELPDLNEYGKVITSRNIWSNLVAFGNLCIRRVEPIFSKGSDDLSKVRIFVSDGQVWVVENDCDNLLLREQRE